MVWKIKVDRFYASSKTYNICRYKNDRLTLSIRKWQCPVCGTQHDRDENTSKNLYKIGIAHLTNLRFEHAERHSTDGRSGTTELKPVELVLSAVKQADCIAILRNTTFRFIS